MFTQAVLGCFFFFYLEVEDFIILRVVGFPLDLGLFGFRSVGDERNRKEERTHERWHLLSFKVMSMMALANVQFAFTVCVLLPNCAAGLPGWPL